MWIGGFGKELKLFNLQENHCHTVSIFYMGIYLCKNNKQLVYSDKNNHTLKMLPNTNTTVTMFKTGDWVPRGITSASNDLLVCLFKNGQSKVVRYSSPGIQYHSQCQPLYTDARYITGNGNGDIIVTDCGKNSVIAVDKLGIFRYTYSGKDSNFEVCSVATDSFGNVPSLLQIIRETKFTCLTETDDF